MTIKELYEWAKENEVEEFDLYQISCFGGGFINYRPLALDEFHVGQPKDPRLAHNDYCLMNPKYFKVR